MAYINKKWNDHDSKNDLDFGIFEWGQNEVTDAIPNWNLHQKSDNYLFYN